MNVTLCCLLLLMSALMDGQEKSQPGGSSLVQQAESGDAQAQFEMGRAYEDGKGVAQDDARAVELFRKSADQGNAQAQNSLGVMYALGRGVQRDKEEAVHWYKKAAKQGLPEGVYNVAISYYNGEGINEDMVTAYAWMMVAQRKGDSQAADAMRHISEQLNNRLDISKFRLAVLYEKGDEIPQDMPAAVSLYLELSQPKLHSWYISESQYKLCQLYAAGTGVAQDYAAAKSWCKRSQIAFSYEVLGRMAEKGLGQEKNLREAVEFYKNAAVREVPDGYLDTGRLELEIGSHEQEKNAYFWYYLAVKRRVPGAGQKLRETAAHLNEKEIMEQQKQATAWLKMLVGERERNLKKH